ncbi:4-alpha-glucanotransferase [Candidatus Saccharibacteria bacterium]|nr:MAG: 4-alpha-glucanotransferase [Candidatus Saccharibacteria bacterium]
MRGTTAEMVTDERPSHELRGAGIAFGVDSFGRNLDGVYTDYQGTYGAESEEYLELMEAAGFSEQFEGPFSPPDKFGCSYASDSAFAINWHRISLNELVKLGDLPATTVQNYQRCVNSGDYKKFYLQTLKKGYLTEAYTSFEDSGNYVRVKDFKAWCDKQSYWLDRYAAYKVLKRLPENEGRPWQEWSKGSVYSYGIVSEVAKQYPDVFGTIKYIQWNAAKQALAYKEMAAKHGIKIRGDVPFGVRLESADVWGNRELFDLDEKGYARHVSGAKPDHLAPNGQIWGHPAYVTENPDLIDWWIKRLKHVHELTGGDTRLDYFVGFAHPWLIPAGTRMATEGSRGKGFGNKLLKRLKLDNEFGEAQRLPLYAEAVGDVTYVVRALLKRYDLSHMLVYTFVPWGTDKETIQDLPRNFRKNGTAFSSTHDSETLMGMVARLYESAETGDPAYDTTQTGRKALRNKPQKERSVSTEPWTHFIRELADYCKEEELVHDRNLTDAMREVMLRKVARYAIKSILDSEAETVVTPIWDVLYSRTRFNTPGTYNGQPGFTGQNWTHRYDAAELQKHVAEMRSDIEASDRLKRQLAHLALAKQEVA